jgi:hypothetical protein
LEDVLVICWLLRPDRQHALSLCAQPRNIEVPEKGILVLE